MNWLSIILGALPSILTAVKAVETAIGPGNGQTKKALVLSAIQAGAQASEGIPIPQVAAIGGLIDNVVNAFNQSGVFNRPTPILGSNIAATATPVASGITSAA